jgi:hypothetical protein
MVLGRGAQRRPNPWPFTDGFLDDLQANWDDDVRRWLPALWLDCGPRTAEFRETYTRTVHERLERVFYAAQSRWCRDHGIALTGHPAESNEFGVLRQFQWPGQDMVWRWVVPGNASGLIGAHSCAPKCASSAAVLYGTRHNASEVLGAYGWRLTLDEAKWLLDWHLVRGTNLFYLHACFYSIRGRRAFESEPDIGLHNVWWPYFHRLTDYLRRVCWLLTDGQEICEVAILTDPNKAAWSAAEQLYKSQIDFIYIDAAALAQAEVEAGYLKIGAHQFRAVVCDPPISKANGTLIRLAAEGGLVLTDWQPETLVETLTAELGRDVDWPGVPDLRAIHYRKEGRDFYLFVNEGEKTMEGALSLAAVGLLECWDPLDGTIRLWPGQVIEDRTHTHLRLERRQGLVLAVDSQSVISARAVLPPTPGEILFELVNPWQAFDADGTSRQVPCPGDWAQAAGWETFSGSLHFQTTFSLTSDQLNQPLFLDLGQVGDIAEIGLNEQTVDVLAWAPYITRIDAASQAGVNQLEIRVTNSMANRLEGRQLPSGLLGPVLLRQARQSS